MSRSARESEFEFSSDSFLDIVANLVGIMIILIVIMGIRVGEQAKITAQQEFAAAVESPAVEVHAAVVERKPVEALVSSIPEPKGPTLQDLTDRQQRNVLIEQSNTSRRREYDEQQQKQATLQAELAQWQAALQQLGIQDQQTQTQLAAAQKALTEMGIALSEMDQNIASLKQREELLVGRLNMGHEKIRELDETTKATFIKLLEDQSRNDALKIEIAQLTEKQSALREVIEQKFTTARSHLAILQKMGDVPVASANKILHQMTSLGSIVVKEESHFRLQNGRISYVPILELVELVKKEMDENKDKLLKGEAIYGTVGPLSGYSLRYKASKQEISVVDELRLGGGMVRIGVNYWEIFDSGVDESEPYEIAKMPNSMFIDRVRALNANEKSVTMWVYPDSYDLYQQLRGMVEKAGLTVAARPLPAGIPIAGSPTGSKSLSQ